MRLRRLSQCHHGSVRTLGESPPLRRSPPAAPARTRESSPALRNRAGASTLVGRTRLDGQQRLWSTSARRPSRHRCRRRRRRPPSAASRSKPPTKTAKPAEERLLLRRRAGRSSRRWRRACVCRRAGRSRGATGQQRAAAAPAAPAARRGRGRLIRAAASSMARGRPSRRQHDGGDGRRVLLGQGEAGPRPAALRWAKRATAGFASPARPADVRAAPRRAIASGGTGSRCSALQLQPGAAGGQDLQPRDRPPAACPAPAPPPAPAPGCRAR